MNPADASTTAPGGSFPGTRTVEAGPVPTLRAPLPRSPAIKDLSR